jgi:hypothetical protein
VDAKFFEIFVDCIILAKVHPVNGVSDFGKWILKIAKLLTSV